MSIGGLRARWTGGTTGAVATQTMAQSTVSNPMMGSPEPMKRPAATQKAAPIN